MKRLWKYIPPCLSDVQGFQMAVNATDGMGIVDDPSRYKPFPIGGKGGKGGKAGGRGHDGHHGGKGSGNRVVHSDIRNPDVITGTEAKLLEAFRGGVDAYHPAFVLLANAPSSSMISSDLYSAAERITAESGIPAAQIRIDGSRDYLYGMSLTLEVMGHLLLTERETIPHTVNILGANSIDWTEESLVALEKWLEAEGMQVLSRWGMTDRAERLREASAASVNFVVNVAGLRLARFMEDEFGIPYVVGAPFGKDRMRKLFESPRRGRIDSGQPTWNAPEAADVLVLGEQLTGAAIREALASKGYERIRVLSFFEMDKSLMQSGDRKLTGEDDLLREVSAPTVRLVLGDPDGRGILTAIPRDIPWISLPNPGNQYPVTIAQRVNFCGEGLDLWLEEQLNEVKA